MDLIDRQPEERTNKRTETHACDSISRQAALKIVVKHIGVDGNRACLIDVGKTYGEIYALPSAQPEPHWIPCSERLPDMWDERYLVSLAWGGVGVMEYKSTGFHNYGSFTPVPIESIIAWMPLPEPYRKEGD